MTHLGCTAGTVCGTTAAPFTDGFVDLADAFAFVEFDGRVGAEADTHLASDTDIRVDGGDHR